MAQISDWVETLPEQCPPDGANCPEGKIFYRYLESAAVRSEDFLPTVLRKPADPEATPCVQKSVSMWGDLEAMKKRLGKIGSYQTKKLVSIRLMPGSGLVKNTFRPHHFSWWRARSFNPVEHSTVLSE